MVGGVKWQVHSFHPLDDVLVDQVRSLTQFYSVSFFIIKGTTSCIALEQVKPNATNNRIPCFSSVSSVLCIEN